MDAGLSLTAAFICGWIELYIKFRSIQGFGIWWRRGEGLHKDEYIHIRIQQRNGRKCVTTVQGLHKDYNYNRILKDVKKEFCCNGNVVQDKELGKVIQLQGDQRKNVSNFLIKVSLHASFLLSLLIGSCQCMQWMIFDKFFSSMTTERLGKEGWHQDSRLLERLCVHKFSFYKLHFTYLDMKMT